MKLHIKLSIIITILFPLTALASSDYWQCTTRDSNNKTWSAQNSYQKAAMNLAFSACKKESQKPLSCKASENDCEGFHLGRSTKPYWYCTALDKNATRWKSNYYSNRDDAAMAAQDYCRSKSSKPETCYMNFITCTNINQG